jgi:hypothetical protein
MGLCMYVCMHACMYVLWVLWTASCVWFLVVVVSSVDKIEETTLPIIPARRVKKVGVVLTGLFLPFQELSLQIQ